MKREIKKPSQTKITVNLKEFFGGKVPHNNEFREAVGQAIIDTIVDRAGNSDFFPGSTRKGYSKSYAQSDEGRAAGKKFRGKANLRLTGDMLNLLDITKIDGNTITISWDESEEREKAHGHITGDGTAPRRDFFGIKEKEAKEIKNQFKGALQSFQNQEKARFREKIGAILAKFKDDISGEEDV